MSASWSTDQGPLDALEIETSCTTQFAIAWKESRCI